MVTWWKQFLHSPGSGKEGHLGEVVANVLEDALGRVQLDEALGSDGHIVKGAVVLPRECPVPKAGPHLNHGRVVAANVVEVANQLDASGTPVLAILPGNSKIMRPRGAKALTMSTTRTCSPVLSRFAFGHRKPSGWRIALDRTAVAVGCLSSLAAFSSAICGSVWRGLLEREEEGGTLS